MQFPGYSVVTITMAFPRTPSVDSAPSNEWSMVSGTFSVFSITPTVSGSSTKVLVLSVLSGTSSFPRVYALTNSLRRPECSCPSTNIPSTSGFGKAILVLVAIASAIVPSSPELLLDYP